MKDIDDYYDLVHRLPYIIRYGNIPRIKDENVAEHSFLVAAIVIGLYEKYDFNLGVALLIAISHDMYESVTGDVCHLMKKESPALLKALKKAELEAANMFPLQVNTGNYMYNKDSAESLAVHLADVMQCYFYSKREVELGNENFMRNIMQNSKGRMTELENKLQQYLREE